MRISDWSSDVCSSDLSEVPARRQARHARKAVRHSSSLPPQRKPSQTPECRRSTLRSNDLSETASKRCKMAINAHNWSRVPHVWTMTTHLQQTSSSLRSDRTRCVEDKCVSVHVKIDGT